MYSVSSLPILLDPSKLFFICKEVPPEVVSELRVIFGQPGDLQARADNVHFLLCLMHNCMRVDPRRYLVKVFLPWTGIRQRTRINRDAIEADMKWVREGYGRSNLRRMTGVYRSLVAELFDPYITIATASCQFLENKFEGIERANVAISERTKAEFLAARDGFSHLLSGYDPLVRNAVSHAGSHGVQYQPDSIVFKDIKREKNFKVHKVVWSLDELRARIEALFECVLSIEAVENIFGIDCSEFMQNDVPTRLQFMNYHFDADRRASERAKSKKYMCSIVGSNVVDPHTQLQRAASVLRDNFEARDMPFDGAEVSEDGVLVLSVPLSQSQFTDNEELIKTAMKLLRYGIVASGIFQESFPAIEVVERIAGSRAERLRVRTASALLYEYGEETASLLDVLHDSSFLEGGVPLSIDVDFDEADTADEQMLGDPFPRKQR